MSPRFLASLAGLATVALGAFGAHGLADRLSPEALEWWETATLYALAHALAAYVAPTPAARAFLVGVLLFAGSLYAMALGAPRMLGAVTPFGGLAFLLGWGLTARAAWRERDGRSDKD